jgi:hypothetical protein
MAAGFKTASANKVSYTVCAIVQPSGSPIDLNRDELQLFSTAIEEAKSNVPHRADDAPKPAKQHRRGEVHSLVWLVPVALRGLACAEKRQKSAREL